MSREPEAVIESTEGMRILQRRVKYTETKLKKIAASFPELTDEEIVVYVMCDIVEMSSYKLSKTLKNIVRDREAIERMLVGIREKRKPPRD